MPKGRAPVFGLLLCFALVTGATASAEAPRKSFADVVARLYADKTFVVSPTSLNVVLHIAKDASRGRTAAEIEPLLFDDAMQARNATQDKWRQFPQRFRRMDFKTVSRVSEIQRALCAQIRGNCLSGELCERRRAAGHRDVDLTLI